MYNFEYNIIFSIGVGGWVGRNLILYYIGKGGGWVGRKSGIIKESIFGMGRSRDSMPDGPIFSTTS